MRQPACCRSSAPLPTGAGGHPLICSSKPPLFRLWQAFCAPWNWGELGPMIPVKSVILISACELGSGKSGSPWDRMQSLYLSALAAISAGVRSARLGGTSFWQAFVADWNCGDGDRGLRPGLALKANPPPAAGTGPGKLLSPWERMHTAYFSNCASVGPDGPEEPEPAALGWVRRGLGVAKAGDAVVRRHAPARCHQGAQDRQHGQDGPRPGGRLAHLPSVTQQGPGAAPWSSSAEGRQ